MVFNYYMVFHYYMVVFYHYMVVFYHYMVFRYYMVVFHYYMVVFRLYDIKVSSKMLTGFQVPDVNYHRKEWRRLKPHGYSLVCDKLTLNKSFNLL